MAYVHRFGRPLALAMAVALAAALPLAAQTQLSGGATTVSVPAGEQRPAFTFTNKTGVPICDLVITRGAGGWSIEGCVVDDPQHTDEDWDVDDNNDGTISGGAGGENSTTPGSGAGQEGGGGAALGHADNRPPTAGGSVRVQEVGADSDNESKCVGANRNFQVTCQLSAAAMKDDTLRIQPTNVRDANICAFAADGLIGRDALCMVTPDRAITTAFVAFGKDYGLIHSIHVQVAGVDADGDGQPALLLELESTPPGIVDLAGGTIFFQPPLDASRGVKVYGVLSDFAAVTLSVEGEPGVPPAEPEPRSVIP